MNAEWEEKWDQEWKKRLEKQTKVIREAIEIVYGVDPTELEMVSDQEALKIKLREIDELKEEGAINEHEHRNMRRVVLEKYSRS